MASTYDWRSYEPFEATVPNGAVEHEVSPPFPAFAAGDVLVMAGATDITDLVTVEVESGDAPNPFKVKVDWGDVANLGGKATVSLGNMSFVSTFTASGTSISNQGLDVLGEYVPAMAAIAAYSAQSAEASEATIAAGAVTLDKIAAAVVARLLPAEAEDGQLVSWKDGGFKAFDLVDDDDHDHPFEAAQVRTIVTNMVKGYALEAVGGEIPHGQIPLADDNGPGGISVEWYDEIGRAHV